MQDMLFAVLLIVNRVPHLLACCIKNLIWATLIHDYHKNDQFYERFHRYDKKEHPKQTIDVRLKMLECIKNDKPFCQNLRKSWVDSGSKNEFDNYLEITDSNKLLSMGYTLAQYNVILTNLQEIWNNGQVIN